MSQFETYQDKSTRRWFIEHRYSDVSVSGDFATEDEAEKARVALEVRWTELQAWWADYRKGTA